MVTRRTLKQAFLGREVALAFAILAGLYLVRYVRVQPLQIPAYLLIVAYDLVGVALPVLTPYYSVGFPLFLYLLAVIVGAAASGFQSGDDDGVTWRRAAGGVCLLIGIFSLALGAAVGGPLVSPADNPTPLVVTGTAGVVLLVGGWWLLGRPSALRDFTG